MPFVIGAYAAVGALVLFDLLMPWLQRRQLLRDLRGRLLRERQRTPEDR